jgi:hypothetical protein
MSASSTAFAPEASGARPSAAGTAYRWYALGLPVTRTLRADPARMLE